MTVMIFIHLILVFRNSVFFPSLTIQSFFPFTVARHQWQFIKWTQAQYRVWRIDYCWTEVVLSWLGRSIGRLAIRFARWLSGCAQFTAFVLWRLWTCGLFNHSIVFALCCALRAKKKNLRECRNIYSYYWRAGQQAALWHDFAFKINYLRRFVSWCLSDSLYSNFKFFFCGVNKCHKCHICCLNIKWRIDNGFNKF